MGEVRQPLTQELLDAAEPEGQRLAQLLAKLESAIDELEQSDRDWASLAAAERTAALRLAVRVAGVTARLLVGRLS